jgi:hypothetical protein
MLAVLQMNEGLQVTRFSRAAVGTACMTVSPSAAKRGKIAGRMGCGEKVRAGGRESGWAEAAGRNPSGAEPV